MSQIKKYRHNMTLEDILDVLAEYEVYPERETPNSYVFRTCCHNLEGGKHKLYLYKQDKIFKCYTQCGQPFDVFELVIKMDYLRGIETTLPQALRRAGVENDPEPTNKDVMTDLRYLGSFQQASQEMAEHIAEESIKIIDKKILDNFEYHEIGLKSWLDEGITKEAMDRFGIKYDPIRNAIVIPNLDTEGNLIGIRGRFLNPNTLAKYMPLKIGNTIYNHPTGKFLYGYHQNKEAIRKKRLAILFEGEKSVLKMESMFPGNNVGLATLGQRVTLDNLQDLIPLGISEVVIAFDRDYTNKDEYEERYKAYQNMAKILTPFFRISYIMDDEFILEHKDSPIDRGKEKFELLLKNRKR